jgi:hypothetical protein
MICRLGWHWWGAWINVARGGYLHRKRIAGFLVNQYEDGEWIGQERQCRRCGCVEQRTVDIEEKRS